MMLEVIKIERWTDILTAREVSINLGMNPKYVYHLWKRDSDMLLDGSVEMKGSTLLITKEGYEHLKMLTKKESDLAINWANSKVNNEVLVPLLELSMIYYTESYRALLEPKYGFLKLPLFPIKPHLHLQVQL